jgi:hypothetical protein
VDLFADGQSWDLPASDPVVALEARLREALPGAEFEVRQGDLYSIAREERDVVLDAMAEGGGFPFVLVDRTCVQSESLEPGAIEAALRAAEKRAG